MTLSEVNELKTSQGGVRIGSQLPTSPSSYYAVASNDVDNTEWSGGETFYLTADNRFYVQTATSGTTATWKRKLEATITA